MTTASELMSEPVATPEYDILRAAYAELRVTDLAASERFYADHLGMIVTERTSDALYLRGWEERLHHSLILRRSSVPTAARLGFRVRRESDLDLLAKDLTAQGLTTSWVDAPDPGVGRVLRAWDPFGYPLEFFYEMQQFETQLQRFDLHRGAPILRFDHLNLHTPRPEDAFRFWTGLGFRCSEYISTDGPEERITGAWLLRKPSVHDVALTAGRGPRLHHTAFWVGEPAGVLRVCDQLAAGGAVHAIERGPGRHGVSNAFFVYLRDPDGHRIELYSCDYYTGDPDLKPLRWSVNDARCRSFWGTRAPDSWYEESSSIVGPDGEVVATQECTVDERTEVMA
ncbi:MAG TPA: 3,4-dihydroxyphenylacetate 2,3-dioxygenase [Baekduia sp.]|nr:3,4-dihydroxyphenylacetate 2,3-dioxygenase [Baekduia sp.]